MWHFSNHYKSTSLVPRGDGCLIAITSEKLYQFTRSPFCLNKLAIKRPPVQMSKSAFCSTGIRLIDQFKFPEHEFAVVDAKDPEYESKNDDVHDTDEFLRFEDTVARPCPTAIDAIRKVSPIPKTKEVPKLDYFTDFCLQTFLYDDLKGVHV